MKQRIARRNAIANRENAPAVQHTIVRGEITRDQVSDLLAVHPELRQDTRTRVLIDLISQYGDYTAKLGWLARNLADEARKNETWGMHSVYDTIMSTSLIRDIAEHAAKFCALKSVLERVCRAASDPASDALDDLIRTLDR